jgi:hypothetical protein
VVGDLQRRADLAQEQRVAADAGEQLRGARAAHVRRDGRVRAGEAIHVARRLGRRLVEAPERERVLADVVPGAAEPLLDRADVRPLVGGGRALEHERHGVDVRGGRPARVHEPPRRARDRRGVEPAGQVREHRPGPARADAHRLQEELAEARLVVRVGAEAQGLAGGEPVEALVAAAVPRETDGVPRRHHLDAAVGRAVERRQEDEVAADPRLVRLRVEPRGVQDLRDAAPPHDALLAGVPEERPRPERVARRDQLARARIVKREREVADQPRQRRRPEALARGEDDLGVVGAGRCEPAIGEPPVGERAIGQRELGAQLGRVVEAPVPREERAARRPDAGARGRDRVGREAGAIEGAGERDHGSAPLDGRVDVADARIVVHHGAVDLDPRVRQERHPPHADDELGREAVEPQQARRRGGALQAPRALEIEPRRRVHAAHDGGRGLPVQPGRAPRGHAPHHAVEALEPRHAEQHVDPHERRRALQAGAQPPRARRAPAASTRAGRGRSRGTTSPFAASCAIRASASRSMRSRGTRNRFSSRSIAASLASPLARPSQMAVPAALSAKYAPLRRSRRTAWPSSFRLRTPSAMT